MSVKIRNQIRRHYAMIYTEDNVRWGVRQDTSARKTKTQVTTTPPIPTPPIPTPPVTTSSSMTFIDFEQRVNDMIDKIEDINILRSKALPDTSLNRTLRFEKIHATAGLLFFIDAHFPAVYANSSDCIRLASVIINWINDMDRSLTNFKASVGAMSKTESTQVVVLEFIIVNCHKTIQSL